MIMTREENVREAAETIQKLAPVNPEVALILGSGLGDFADELRDRTTIPAADIPHYPTSSVQGHAGKLVFGTVSQNQKESPPLLVFQGRVHFYESGDLTSTLFPVSLAKALGVSTLIVTNAAGGINRSFTPGDLMLITDVLSLAFLQVKVAGDLPRNPVIASRFGTARPTSPFHFPLQEVIRQAARELSLPLQEGTYCWVKGPSYETAAEIEMLFRTGVDAVGMSTVPEISLATRLGLKVAGISLISNLATGISTTKLSHQEVTETATKVKSRFTNLLSETLLRL